jgi:PBP1b-binding outer membrane lipoprotein LpoB
MMSRLLLAILASGLVLAGCSGGADRGDVAAAEKAAAAAPKSEADLPQDMPEQARRQAAAAMQQAQALQQQGDAQAEAMRRARAQGGIR